jgi:hypothetical protein
MGLEAATYIADLVTTNPPGTDKKNQGDDHIRLIKTVLKNTFPNANKAFTASKGVTKTTTYAVVAADDKTVISVDTTTAAFNLTLPVLALADAGWSIDVIKINTGPNPVFLAPAAGTVNGLAYVRRTLEYMLTRVVWTGSSFYASRPNGGNVGQLRQFAGPNLPNDCLWPDGQTFVASNYPELQAALGGTTKPDIRGRTMLGRDNMGVGAAGLLGAFINGAALWSAGGSEWINIAQNQLPQVAINTTDEFANITAAVNNHLGQWVANFGGGLWNGGGGGGIDTPGITITDNKHHHQFVLNGNVAQQPTSQLPPSIIVNVGLVAE